MINLSQLGSSLIRGVLEPGEGSQPPPFSKGEIVEGKVIKSIGGGGALVRLRGVELMASTNRPLVTGQALLVRVDQVKPDFIVSLLTNDTPLEEKTAALLRMYLPSSAPIGRVIADISALLDSLPRAALKGSDMETVLGELYRAMKHAGGKGRGALDVIGFSHEAELARGRPSLNLKRSLLIVRRNLEGMMETSRAAYREAYKAVTEALNNIELRQLINAPEKQDVKTWEIPFWNGQDISSAKLYVTREKKGKGGQKGGDEAVRLILTLSMSRLGNIRAEALALKKNLDIIIYGENGAVAEEIEGKARELSDALYGMGFNASISVERATKEFIVREPEENASLPVKGLLNLRV